MLIRISGRKSRKFSVRFTMLVFFFDMNLDLIERCFNIELFKAFLNGFVDGKVNVPIVLVTAPYSEVNLKRAVCKCGNS